jgi:hypothetical protein
MELFIYNTVLAVTGRISSHAEHDTASSRSVSISATAHREALWPYALALNLLRTHRPETDVSSPASIRFERQAKVVGCTDNLGSAGSYRVTPWEAASGDPVFRPAAQQAQGMQPIA